MVDLEKRKPIPMRELERLTKFSRATINYYIREGILPLPQKSARNMAYYDLDFIHKLEHINRLKKAGFSLKQIKQVLTSERQMDNSFLKEVLNNINRLMPGGSAEQNTTLQQIKALGFDAEEVRELIKMNLILPVDAEGVLFPPLSLTICELVRYFMNYGIPMAVTKSVVQKILELTLIEKEAFFTYMCNPLLENGSTSVDQGKAIQNCVEKINALLPLIHLQLLKIPAESLVSLFSTND